jgi:hypothetical protein
MSEEKPIRKADLARHWRVSPPYITKLVKKKGMPCFTDLASADAWRAVNAPPKPSNQKPIEASMENGIEADKKIAVFSGTTKAPESKQAPGPESASGTPQGLPPNTNPPAEVIDVLAFIRTDKDFDALMIEQAERVPQIAYGLFLRASNRCNPAEIAAANKNWHESAKAAAAVRGEFLSLQERTGTLIPLDRVMDIVGTEMQALRAALAKFGERCGPIANPADPLLAQRAIDAGIDRLLQLMVSVESRAAKELAPPATIAAAQAQ